MSFQIKKFLAVLTLCLGSVGSVYVVLELSFPYLLHLLPLKTHGYLDWRTQTLAQYSKARTIPKDYVLIAGDSYAVGKGDWLLNANQSTTPPYSSAHLIFQHSGRDVITTGRSGHGSLISLAREPAFRHLLINAFTHYQLDAPDQILVYFYEGNDLNDNLRELRKFYDDEYNRSRILEFSYFQEFVADKIHEADRVERITRRMGVSDNLLFKEFLKKLVKSYFDDNASDTQRVYKERNPGKHNRALVGGSEVWLPNRLQGPALELTEEEIQLAFYVFERSIDYLKDQFPDSSIGVVYIPSPIASYNIVSPKVHVTDLEKRNTLFGSESMRHQHRRFVDKVRTIAAERQLPFANATDSIREATSGNFLHGPRDWRHFNRKGYETLAGVAIKLLGEMRQEEGQP